MILINQSRNHRYPLINRLSTRRPWQSRRVIRVRGSVGRYYNNNRRSPDLERLFFFFFLKLVINIQEVFIKKCCTTLLDLSPT